MESFAKIVEFIMFLIDLIKKLVSKHDDGNDDADEK